MSRIKNYIPLVIVLVAAAIVFFFDPNHQELMWVASLTLVAILDSFSPKPTLRYFAVSFSFLFAGLLLKGFIGFVSIGVAEITACSLILYLQGRDQLFKYQEGLLSFLFVAVTAFLSINLYYLHEGNYYGVEAIFCLIAFLKLTEFPLQSALRSLISSQHSEEDLADLFFGLLTIGTLFFLTPVKDLAHGDLVILIFATLTSLTRSVNRTLVLFWLYLTIRDPALGIFGGPIAILLLSPYLTLFLGPLVLGLFVLMTNGLPSSQEGLTLAGLICFLVGRGLVLRRPTQVSRQREITVGVVFISLIGFAFFLEETTLVSRFTTLEGERISLAATLLISSILFFFLGAKWPRATGELKSFEVWKKLLTKLRYENRLTGSTGDDANDEKAREMSRFERALRNEPRQLLFWLALIAVAIWSAMWFDQ